MKNLLKQLGINVTEFSYLLFLPEQTLHTWFNRNSSIPPPHNIYFSSLEAYQGQKKVEDLEVLNGRWEKENQAMLEKEQATRLKELKANLSLCTFQLEKLKRKEMQLLNRWHLAENYPPYLSPELQNTEQVQEWCGLIGRKSKFQLGDVKPAIWKLEQKIAGLEAEVAYWEGKIK